MAAQQYSKFDDAPMRSKRTPPSPKPSHAPRPFVKPSPPPPPNSKSSPNERHHSSPAPPPPPLHESPPNPHYGFKKLTLILDESEISDSRKPVVCARCHSLRHYQKLKDPSVEKLLPDFDFDHTVGRKLMSISKARTVVLLVVDASDFDDSFPGKVATLLSKTIDVNARSWKEGKSGNIPRMVLVGTQARECGAGKLTSLNLVRAVRDWGVKTLVDDVVNFAGARGHVWAVGAQNAGKSTLRNAIGECVVRTPNPHLHLEDKVILLGGGVDTAQSAKEGTVQSETSTRASPRSNSHAENPKKQEPSILKSSKSTRIHYRFMKI